ncbi:MAG: polyprenyl synthetase family protein [Oligoflexia bacterium]|nr:polyprenyl synthetase family protein [Oligoflexia bacterium]
METNETIPTPSAAADLGKKIKLTLETKRLLQEIEKEVSDLDWNLEDKFGVVPRLSQPAYHLLLAGGKRIRPLLIALLSKALETSFDKLKPCAIASELVHTATLLHDDVLDAATMRRGRVAAYLKYGAHTAILSGDALLSKAISEVAQMRDPEILQRLADTVRELVEGECLQADLVGTVHGDIDAVIEVARRKTASLFAWSAWVVGHSKNQYAKELFHFGSHLGIAFQILDDILDWEGKDTGKDRYLDLHESKLNVVGAKLVNLSSTAASLLEKSFSQADKHGYISNYKELGVSLSSLKEYNETLDWAKREAEKHSQFSLAHLEKIPASPWKDLTIDLSNRLLARMK